MHGGGWLTVGGTAVDVLFRDLDVVERHVAAAELEATAAAVSAALGVAPLAAR